MSKDVAPTELKSKKRSLSYKYFVPTGLSKQFIGGYPREFREAVGGVLRSLCRDAGW